MVRTKTKRLAQEEKTESKRKKALDRELEWVRQGQKVDKPRVRQG